MIARICVSFPCVLSAAHSLQPAALTPQRATPSRPRSVRCASSWSIRTLTAWRRILILDHFLHRLLEPRVVRHTATATAHGERGGGRASRRQRDGVEGQRARREQSAAEEHCSDDGATGGIAWWSGPVLDRQKWGEVGEQLGVYEKEAVGKDARDVVRSIEASETSGFGSISSCITYSHCLTAPRTSYHRIRLITCQLTVSYPLSRRVLSYRYLCIFLR